MTNLQIQLKQALEECKRLQEENCRLKDLLKKHKIKFTHYISENTSKQEIIQKRIGIFRNLFKGRSDVYAVRWESKSGRSGYMPACKHEWTAGVCEKPKIKCSECIHQKYLPLTDDVIFDHLSGKVTVGLYPLLKNEECHFLAVDFDKEGWTDDIKAFRQICKETNVPVLIERSRSGNGGHAWIFFREPISASLARRFGKSLLSKTLERRYEVGIESFDRMFPNQSHLSAGGLGNLIALPLQGTTRKLGNSVFVDENFEMYEDQWGLLSSVKKLSKNDLRNTMETIQDTREEITPQEWPKHLTITLKEGIHFNREQLPSTIGKKMLELGSFSNPEFYKAKARRQKTNHLPSRINCSDQTESELILPRGCLDDITEVLEQHGVGFEIIDQTCQGESFNFELKGSLYPQQREAVEELSKFNTGILSASTGFGKTVVGAAMIEARQQNTLIIVHRKQLLEQWKERLTSFLDLNTDKIGQIGGGKNKPAGLIDVGTIQTLAVKPELIKNYAHIIVDECHHISAFTFEKVLKSAKAKYVLGLTATPNRKDGLQPIVTMQCGPVRYKVNPKKQAKVHAFDHILVPRKTNLKVPGADSKTIGEIYKELYKSEKRNAMIFDDVLNALEEGRSPIILTERQEHIKMLEEKLSGFAKNIIVLKGGLAKKVEEERLAKIKEVPDTEERIIIATGKYIGEGFDDPRLDTLFLTMPISWKGTLQQYAGRLHRTYDNKESVKVYDYVDVKVPVLNKMYEKRLAGYKSLGYKLSNEKYEAEQMKLF